MSDVMEDEIDVSTEQPPEERRSSSRAKKVVVSAPERPRLAAQQAAMEFLQGKHTSLRKAAEAHKLLRHTNVQYWVNQWKGTDMEHAFKLQQADPAPAAAPAPTTEKTKGSLPTDVEVGSKQKIQQFMAKEAGAHVKKSKNALSYREAATLVNEKYESYGVTVSHVLVHRYANNDEYDPSPKGRAGYLPAEFYERLCKWIRAMRALRFPMFKDTVVAAANYTLEGTNYLQKFKHQRLDSDWYYRFLKTHNHLFSTANQRPLEITRAKWATAANIGQWYDMIADVLVDKGLAVKNPNYDVNAKPGSADCEPIHITKPDRILSFDESRIELDMTQATKSNESRTIVDKQAPASSRQESLANKGGLCGTGVGGSTASGKALPGLFIMASGSIEASWCTPAPLSDFLDGSGARVAAKFTCNPKGGVRDCVGVQYLSHVIVPLFPDLSEDNPVVLICDGHGSHLTLDLLEYCRAHHVHVVLRVPHTTHLTQGEDVRNFKIFKPAVRTQKNEALQENISRGVFRLLNKDFMRVVEPAWRKAFSTENNLKGWRETGISPFNQCVLHQLKEEETRRDSLNKDAATINYERLSMAFAGEANEDRDAEEHDAELLHGRISSADLYSMGPVTSDRAFNIIKERNVRKERERAEKEERAVQRASHKSRRAQDLTEVFGKLVLDSKVCIRELKARELEAVLLCSDHGNEKKHKELKSKAAKLDYILQLPQFASLPEGDAAAPRAQQQRRATGAGKRKAARPPLDSSDSDEEESEESEEEDNDGAKDTYEVDHFVAARKQGRVIQIRVRWDGYGSGDDTWEPASQLRATQNDKVEQFLADWKAQGNLL